MNTVYVVSGVSTAFNGDVIHWTDSAYTDEQTAIDVANRMYEENMDDPAYITYVTGPIPLYEKIEV